MGGCFTCVYTYACERVCVCVWWWVHVDNCRFCCGYLCTYIITQFFLLSFIFVWNKCVSDICVLFHRCIYHTVCVCCGESFNLDAFNSIPKFLLFKCAVLPWCPRWTILLCSLFYNFNLVAQATLSIICIPVSLKSNQQIVSKDFSLPNWIEFTSFVELGRWNEM